MLFERLILTKLQIFHIFSLILQGNKAMVAARYAFNLLYFNRLSYEK